MIDDDDVDELDEVDPDLEEEDREDGESPDTEATVMCPYCWASVEITLDPGSGNAQEYVEDCEICCQPWQLHVHYDEEGRADVVVTALDEA